MKQDAKTLIREFSPDLMARKARELRFTGSTSVIDLLSGYRDFGFTKCYKKAINC
jgi:hypothetical protein